MGRHSLVVAYLLWLPPLGWLGLHQCYLGRHYHGIVLFTTFAGFVVGWFRDLWRIPSYVRKANKEDEEDDGQRGCFCCCCWPLLLCKCFKCFFGLFQARGEESKESQQTRPDLSGDVSDEDTTTAECKPSGQPVMGGGQREGAGQQFYKKAHQELVETITVKAKDLLNDFVYKSVDQTVSTMLYPKIEIPEEDNVLDESQKQDILNSVIQEIATILLAEDSWSSFFDKSKEEELREKIGKTLQSEHVQLYIQQQLVTNQQKVSLTAQSKGPDLKSEASVTQPHKRVTNPMTATDNRSKQFPGASGQEFSDDEYHDEVSGTRAHKRRVNPKGKLSGQIGNTNSQDIKPPAVPKHYLRVWDNLERIGAVFLVSRYYRAVVSAAVSDHMESILIFQWFLKLLPPLAMISGVYLVSNIGKPRRLTFYKVLLCSIVAEILILHVLAGLQILVCLACTILTVFFWKVKPAKQSSGSSRATCLVITVCAVTAMSLVWGSIIMNTTIEVDGDSVTVSEAFSNFYNSPGWSRMKESIWVTMTMSWEGNWDEAGETLLRMSDLSGIERALEVLGLSRDVDQAAIKARYKKLAREWHPDKYQGVDKEAASNKFIEIQQAYTLLTKKLRANF